MHFPQPGKSAVDLWLERSVFAGVVLSGVFYGLHLAVFSVSTYFVINAPATGKVSWPFLSLLVCLFVIGTLQVASQARYGELIWIDNRGFTGGPAMWYISHFHDPTNILGRASLIFGNFLADGVLLYRMFIIWDRSILAMVFPILAYIASSTLSVLAVFQDAQPNSTKWSPAVTRFEIPYWALTAALNIAITIALAFRLMKMRRAAIETLGRDHAKLYTSVITYIVESAVIYSGVGLVCIIAYLSRSQILNLAEPILAQVLCICPELIILRVSRMRKMTQSVSARQALVARPMAMVPGKQLSVSAPVAGSTSEGSFESYVDF